MLKSIINQNEKKFSINSVLLINLTLAFFPISFILGNLIINLNLLLFCILGIFYLRSKILTTKYNLSIKIIFLLFFAIFFSTSLSFIKFLYTEGYEYEYLERLVKSIIFFRYFLMLIIIYLLSEHNVLNFKYLFKSAAFSTLIVALDVIYQYIFGFNIIGLRSGSYHNSSFFGDEYITGGYIQNFSFFLVLFLMFELRNKNNLRFILTTITICILGTSIMLSGNKMPLILFLFGLLMAFLLDNKLRKIILVSLVCCFVLFKFILSSDTMFKNRYSSLFTSVKHTFGTFYSGSELKNDTEKNYEEQENSMLTEEKNQRSSWHRKQIGFLNDRSFQGRLLLTALDIWKQNKLFGNGIKSFRIDCYKLKDIYAEKREIKDLIDYNPVYEYNYTETYDKSKKNRICSNHPHNYYFEILTETGVVGIFITLMIASLFIVFILKNFKFLKGNNIENFILLAATISLFLEAFPLRSSGSFFTTNNATYITLISSIILSYRNKLTKHSE